MSVGNDPGQQRPHGEGGRGDARLSRSLVADVRHDADLDRLVDLLPGRWSDALLAETRFHLSGLMNAIELAIALHVTDADAEQALARLGPGYARTAIEDELGLLTPDLLAHLRRRATIAMLLRQHGAASPAGLSLLAGDAAHERYADTLASLAIAERRWCAPMLLAAPMRPDLPAEQFHDLAWTVAALMIRGCELNAIASGPALVKALARATDRLIAQHDEGQGAFALAQRCARSLPADMRLALAPAALVEGRLLLFAALAERETGLPLDELIDALTGESDEARFALLRMMGVDDAVAFAAADMLTPFTGLSAHGDAALAAFVEGYRRFETPRAEYWLAARVRPRALGSRLAHMAGTR